MDLLNKTLQQNHCNKVNRYYNDELGIDILGMAQPNYEFPEYFDICTKIIVEENIKLYITFNKNNAPDYTNLEETSFKNFCRDVNCNFVSLSIIDYTAPTFEQLLQLWKILDEFYENKKLIGNTNNKVLLHCEGGHGRTGFMIISYIWLKKSQKDISYSPFYYCLSDKKNYSIYDFLLYFKEKTINRINSSTPSDAEYYLAFDNINYSIITTSKTIIFLQNEIKKYHNASYSEVFEEYHRLSLLLNRLIAFTSAYYKYNDIILFCDYKNDFFYNYITKLTEIEERYNKLIETHHEFITNLFYNKLILLFLRNENMVTTNSKDTNLIKIIDNKINKNLRTYKNIYFYDDNVYLIYKKLFDNLNLKLKKNILNKTNKWSIIINIDLSNPDNIDLIKYEFIILIFNTFVRIINERINTFFNNFTNIDEIDSSLYLSEKEEIFDTHLLKKMNVTLIENDNFLKFNFNLAIKHNNEVYVNSIFEIIFSNNNTENRCNRILFSETDINLQYSLINLKDLLRNTIFNLIRRSKQHNKIYKSTNDYLNLIYIYNIYLLFNTEQKNIFNIGEEILWINVIIKRFTNDNISEDDELIYKQIINAYKSINIDSDTNIILNNSTMVNNDKFYKKYIKYKNKYIKIKNK
jgi:protein-tyrosine phosphatase